MCMSYYKLCSAACTYNMHKRRMIFSITTVGLDDWHEYCMIFADPCIRQTLGQYRIVLLFVLQLSGRMGDPPHWQHQMVPLNNRQANLTAMSSTNVLTRCTACSAVLVSNACKLQLEISGLWIHNASESGLASTATCKSTTVRCFL